jgi:ABC-2 type transport system permease protein
MSKLLLIIKREFLAKVRNKSFIVMTFLSPMILVAMSLFIGYLVNMNKGKITKIALHDQTGILKTDFKNSKTTLYIDLSGMSLQQAKETAKKYYQGLIYIPKTTTIHELASKTQYISDESPSLEFIFGIENTINEKLNRDNLTHLGFDYQKIENAKVKSNIQLTKFSGEEGIKFLNEIKIAIGASFGYLIMMFIIIYGNFVMRSVIEEKTSRIIEIIISSVKPYQLMMGKIIGNAMAGILQFLIWICIGVGLLFVISLFIGHQPELGAMAKMQPQALQVLQNTMDKFTMYYNEIPVLKLFAFFIIYFIGGYFLYSSFYAAIGAAVDSETDSQQFLLPIIMPLMLGVYVGFFTVMTDPHGTIATIFSMIPLTSPIVMLMRIPFGVPWWQLTLSITLLFGTFFSTVWVASKIYRIGILMYGKKPTWAELYKWLRY